ncbi:TonB-dependent receptor [Shewanella surugensis]|uniref:TonB-dependent receptor n=1 Tax=Shewanella surugensis TaxID=212020 RepID=A0ABT0L7M5_9GAMM|nr:TonB-dependent receptor [Shewanella surugensis]MCL1123656.1 TonB-dependent receptor [Shewanella surugensis]
MLKLRISPFALFVAATFAAPYTALADTDETKPTSLPDDDMEVMVVTSDFRGAKLEDIPASITVIDQQQMEDEGAQHFEDILNSVANLNWSGGSSRPKYFQIRGVGEQEEYKGAPNSSVGYIIDDIDLSGLGMVSSLYDLQQVEVLRGPQGTQYGANALAGLIYLKSNDPTVESEHGAEVSVGSDDLRTFSGYSSGSVTDSGDLLYRVSLQQHNQNGYMNNQYLGRDDTNARDEFTGHGKLRWLATDDLQFDLSLLFANYNNGYDAWTLDNNGENTLTDTPGVDEQKTTGASLKTTYDGFDKFEITSLSSVAKTTHTLSYDGDWANPEYWSALTCDGEPCQYDYFWGKTGHRQTLTQEVRVNSSDNGRLFFDSTDWLVGVYAMDLTEDNDLYSEYNTYPDEVLQSDYDAQSYAVFGQLDPDLGNGFLLSLGLRLERRFSDYSDSNKETYSPNETLWGGHVSLSKALSNTQESYIRIARGYKAGGFNMSLPSSFSDKTQFDSETLYNYELGLKSSWLDGDVSSNFALFYMDRQNQQVSASQQDPDNPQRFILYTENANTSSNYGAELETHWYATDNLMLYSSFGWLETAYGDYVYQDKYGNNIDLSGRELAHAPKFNYSLGATYRTDSGWFANVTGSGKSAFYYSDSNESRSSAYQIYNARIGFEAQDWAVYLWGKNLLDEQYGTRGYYFGNEPDLDWSDKQYIRYGDPRQIGLTLKMMLL